VYLPQLRMPFEQIVERTLAAESCGFDSVWLMDHLWAPAAPEVDTLEGWTLAAALAVQTSEIRIGHLTTCDPFRHPAVLAKMAATIDTLSGGRLELGIGWGSVPDELAAFGITTAPGPRRAARLRESLEIIERMFGGEPFDYDGDHFTLRGAIGRPTPIQDHLPIHVGGGGTKLTMPIVRDHADWWNCPGYAYERLDELRPLAGDARVSVQHAIGLAPGSAARDEVTALVHRRFGVWGGVIAGTAPEIVDALRTDIDRGVEGFVLQFHDFGVPETLDRFAGEVLGALR